MTVKNADFVREGVQHESPEEVQGVPIVGMGEHEPMKSVEGVEKVDEGWGTAPTLDVTVWDVDGSDADGNTYKTVVVAVRDPDDEEHVLMNDYEGDEIARSRAKEPFKEWMRGRHNQFA